jgi:hypothetical protein
VSSTTNVRPYRNRVQESVDSAYRLDRLVEGGSVGVRRPSILEAVIDDLTTVAFIPDLEFEKREDTRAPYPGTRRTGPREGRRFLTFFFLCAVMR